MFNSPIFKPIKNDRKIFEQISDQIRELIFSGVLKPGDKLPSEKELSSQFGTGRMVIREALRTLEQSGLIYVKRGSLGGAFIKNIDTSVIIRSLSDMIKVGSISLRELTEARLGIEKIILEFALPNIRYNHLDLIKKTIENAEKRFSIGERATEEHIQFHILIAKATRNTLFETIIVSIMDVTKSFLLSFKPDFQYIQNVLIYHKKIYQSIMDRDLDKAKRMMEEHILDVNQKLMSLTKT
jgi:DNA-binding FadR family transcriptional regulator